jgi:TRAP-type uncharacterized transport system fused permease subunit
MIVDIAGDNLLLALVFVMITAIVLGMGLPLSSAYIVQVGVAIPALVTMLKHVGFPAENAVPQAHLFVIFFSAFSSITPPTAPTSYAAAAIASAPVMATALEAMKLALPAFLLPFLFVYDPSLLMIGPDWRVAVSVVLALGGVVAMGMAVQNYCFAALSVANRLLLFLCGVALIGPRLTWNLVGLAVAVGVMVYQRLQTTRRRTEVATS